LELNGTHQLLVYADDITLLGENINTIKKNIETQTLIKFGQETNAEKSIYGVFYISSPECKMKTEI
jgi:hypothetical protein